MKRLNQVLCDVLNIYLAELHKSGESYPDQRDEALEILDRCLEGMTWGRMYQDPNIDPEMAMKFYRDTSSWILNQECCVSISRENNRGVGLAIGVIDGKMSENIGCHYGFLWLIAVDPEFQGKGVGRNLFYKFHQNLFQFKSFYFQYFMISFFEFINIKLNILFFKIVKIPKSPTPITTYFLPAREST